jgi:hypothetical protein
MLYGTIRGGPRLIAQGPFVLETFASSGTATDRFSLLIYIGAACGASEPEYVLESWPPNSGMTNLHLFIPEGKVLCGDGFPNARVAWTGYRPY